MVTFLMKDKELLSEALDCLIDQKLDSIETSKNKAYIHKLETELMYLRTVQKHIHGYSHLIACS